MRRFYLLLCFSFLFSLNINAQITSPLSEKEEEALEFLKTYMPLSDIADYDEDFFRAQVKTAFQAREFFSWGKTIPDEVFRRFVLVYRVNNPIDNHYCLTYYGEPIGIDWYDTRYSHLRHHQSAL